MRMARGLTVALIAGVLLPMIAVAQSQGINWQRDPRAAVSAAQRANRPLMFYVIGASRGREDFSDDHRRAFQDPVVVRLSQRFIAVQLQRSQHRELVEGWSVGPNSNGDIVFTKPDGKEIGTIGASGVSKVDSLRQKLFECFRAFRDDLFTTDLQPVLTNEESPAKDVRAALKLIDEYVIESADGAVVALTNREKLDPAVRIQAFETLAKLSRPAGIRRLAEAAEKDKAAADAMKKAQPPAAEALLEQLTPELMSTNPARFAELYQTVTQICRIRNVKQARFWEGTNERVKSEELERVRDLVRKAALNWSAQNEYR